MSDHLVLSRRVFIFMISSLAFSCGKPGTDKITEADVREFVEAYDRAWSTRDTVAMKEMMDERYIYFTSVGATYDRERILSWFTPADKYKVKEALRNEVEIILHDEVGIVSSHWVGSGTFGEYAFNDDQRCGLVIQKINGKIKILSEHCVQIE